MPARLIRQPAAGRSPARLAARAPAPAFTLVELMVAVAICALLVAILMPSLVRARAHVKMVICQNQLRQWGLAFHIYAAGNRNYFPHTDGLDRDNGPADQFGWVDVLPPLIAERPWRDHPPWHKPGVGTFFQCGAAELAPDAHYSYNARRNGYFSYAMNSCLELDESCWRAPGDAGEPMPSFLLVDLIVKPDQVVLLFDQLLKPALGYDGKLTCRSAGKYCGSYPKAFSARHARQPGRLGGSILYCDGHVEWTASVWKPSWPEDMEVPPRDDPNWFPYPPE